jgi:uncharacterized protein (DUF3084 family)
MVNSFTMTQNKTLTSVRDDKNPTRKEQERAKREHDSAKQILAKTNPKIDGNVIKGYN